MSVSTETSAFARPEAPLSAFVESFWYLEAEPTASGRERAFPTGTTEIVIGLDETPLMLGADSDLEAIRESVLIGPHTRHFVLGASRRERVIGIHFRPGGAFPFLDCPVGELENLRLPLEAIWGDDATRLRERLQAAPDHTTRFRILETSLLARARRPLDRHRAVRFALREFTGSGGSCSVARVVEQVGLSSRRFIELFQRETGHTPKMFARILRFQRALALSGAESGWAEIALDCGYHDQAHLIRDFREFSGVSPTVYATHAGDRPNHLAVTD